jgi:hypothetical protein
MYEMLKQLWGGKRSAASQEEVTELTNQFYVTPCATTRRSNVWRRF